MNTQKFGEMRQGQHFQDGRRKFIKLQTILPFGIPQLHLAVTGKDHVAPFNAVDYDGVTANCPEWTEFELL